MQNSERAAIVHHWDADGIAAAALAMRTVLGNRVVYAGVPHIGFYSPEAIDTQGILRRDPDTILVLDYGLGRESYEALANIVGSRARLVVVDHHAVEPWSPEGGHVYCNPVAQGFGGEDEWPSTSYLLHHVLELRDAASNILAALGIVGDLAPYVDAGKPHRGLEIAEDLLRGTGLSIPILRKAVDYVDSCYRVYGTGCIDHVRAILAEKGVEDVLRDPVVGDAYLRAQRLVDEARRSVELVYREQGLAVYRLGIDAYVTSVVGRELAARHPGELVALIHTIPRLGQGFVYIRALGRDLRILAEELRRRGFRVGGKQSVAVVEFRDPVEAEKVVKVLKRLAISSG